MDETRHKAQMHPLLTPYHRQQRAVVDLLYGHAPTGFLITLFVGLIPSLLIWRDLGIAWVWAWYAGLGAIILARIALYFGFRRAAAADEDLDYIPWRRWFVLGAIVSGAWIGVGAAVALPVVDQPVTQVIHFIVLGLAAGAVQYLGSWLPAYLPYMLVVTVPVALSLVLRAQSEDLTMAFLYVFMMATFALGVRNANRLLLQSLYYGFENERLAHDLEGSVDTLSNTNRALQELSTTDELTGMMNRRGFRHRFGLEWRVHQREMVPLALIMIDVDYFKNYNDAYGHLAGDTTLIRIAQLISACLKRPGDVAARFGGEEFVILLPRTNVEGAKEVAENIRDAMQRQDIEHAHSPIAPRITVSMGIVSVVPRSDLDRGQLIEFADQALYEAKERGRDRWEVREVA
jgi:diguanylate cyclase (GGDEF)-like protein